MGFLVSTKILFQMLVWLIPIIIKLNNFYLELTFFIIQLDVAVGIRIVS